MFSAGKAGQDEESVSFEWNISHVELHESSYLDTWTASQWTPQYFVFASLWYQ